MQKSEEKNKSRKGILYIVATPIGNLSDISPRAAAAFESADFIAAEDTRVSAKLLNHLGIKKPMVSYYEHNLKQRTQYILQRVIDGETCALCSDAGTPAISDPGEMIVAKAHECGVKVEPIPGACAAMAALCASGQITSRFVFEGFLPTNKRQKKQRLIALKQEERTIIFYEAPHKLKTTLQDLSDMFEKERSLSICRELTKLHEEIFVTDISGAIQHYNNIAPKGEFVLVMQGARPKEAEQITLQEAVLMAKEFIKQGLSVSAASKKAAEKSGFAKNEIYKMCTEQEKN